MIGSYPLTLPYPPMGREPYSALLPHTRILKNQIKNHYNPISCLTPQRIFLPSGQYLRDGRFGSLQNRVAVIGAECLEIQV